VKTLGLIGGTSWVSTIDYYRLINEGVNHRLGGANFAECLIHSFNYADIQTLTFAGDWAGVERKVAGAAVALRDAGAEGIVLCANTMHVVADGVQQATGLPLIHIVDAVAADVLRRGLTSVALLGTRFTMEMDFFRDRLAASGIRASIPDEPDREFIHGTIFGELSSGTVRAETRVRYLEIITSMAARGAEGVLLACTEIPLVVQQSDTSVPVFDTTAIHASAAVAFALSGARGDAGG
jgi:aspartate racemase